MSTDTIPSRTNGQTIDQLWFNILRTVLSGAVVGRVNGVATTGQALGSAVYRWGNMSLEANIDLYSTAGTLLYRFTQDSGDYVVEDGSANEIARLGSNGWAASSVDGREVETSANINYGNFKSVQRGSELVSQSYTASQSAILTCRINVKAATTAPVKLEIQSSGVSSGRNSYIEWVSLGGGGGTFAGLSFNRNTPTSALLAIHQIDGLANQKFMASAFTAIDYAAPAGQVEYQVDLSNARGDTIDMERLWLVAYQL